MRRRDGSVQYGKMIEYNSRDWYIFYCTIENDDDDVKALVYVKGSQKRKRLKDMLESEVKDHETRSSKSWMPITKM